MFCCYINGSTSLKLLDDGYWCSKEQSWGQKPLNMAFLFAKKRHTAGGMILVLIDSVLIMLGSLSILFSMINIVLQS